MTEKYIEKCLVELGITKFRIISHRIKKTNIKATGEKINFTKSSNNIFILLFVYSNKLACIRFPNCDKKSIRLIIEKYIENDCYYLRCDGKCLSDNLPRVHFASQTQVKNYIDLVKHEVQSVNRDTYTLIGSTHSYIEHKISVRYPEGLTNTAFSKNYILLTVQFQGTIHSLYSEKVLTHGLYNLMISQINNPGSIADLHIGHLDGKILLPANVAQVFVTCLVANMTGSIVLSNQSFIKAKSLGERIFKCDISVFDDPFYNGLCEGMVDAEGTPLRKKILIEHGVIIDCLCDLLSASYLNCTAGNAFFNYNQNSISASASTTHVVVHGDSYQHKSSITSLDVIIQDINPEGFNYDFVTNTFSGQLIGLDVHSGEQKIYSFRDSITSFFDKIISSSGEEKEINNIIISDLILKI